MGWLCCCQSHWRGSWSDSSDLNPFNINAEEQSNRLLLLCGHLFQWKKFHAVLRSSSRRPWLSLAALPRHFWSPEKAGLLELDFEALVTLRNCICILSHQRISQQPTASAVGYFWKKLIISLQQSHIQASHFNLKLMLYHVWSQFCSSGLVYYEYILYYNIYIWIYS